MQTHKQTGQKQYAPDNSIRGIKIDIWTYIYNACEYAELSILHSIYNKWPNSHDFDWFWG